jgi:molybdopterin converting factor small subunit
MLIIPEMSESAVVPVPVSLFARYAELLGTSQVIVRIRPGGTVADVVDGVRALPGGASLPERMLVASGVNQVRYDHPVATGDEFALLPPMSGG